MFEIFKQEFRRRIYHRCRGAAGTVPRPHVAGRDDSTFVRADKRSAAGDQKISTQEHEPRQYQPSPCPASENSPDEETERSQADNRAVRQPWKLRSLRISPDTGKPTGYLWHYGHFIHDLIMPLADWIVEQDIDPAAIDLFIEDTPDQSVGSYVDLITSLLGVRAKLFAPQTFKDIHGKDLALGGYLFGPYKTSSLAHVQQMV